MRRGGQIRLERERFQGYLKKQNGGGECGDAKEGRGNNCEVAECRASAHSICLHDIDAIWLENMAMAIGTWGLHVILTTLTIPPQVRTCLFQPQCTMWQ